MGLKEKVDSFLTGLVIFVISASIPFCILLLGTGAVKFCWDCVAGNPLNAINICETIAMIIVMAICGIVGLVMYLRDKAK